MPLKSWAEWGGEPTYDELKRFTIVSIGFASQDLKSPVSHFGHTFLVFHNQNIPEANALTIEFTGEAPTLTSNISALLTSVPGKYSLNYFSSKVRDYDFENRSIWIYRLNFSDEEINRLREYFLRNSDNKFAYDFGQHNCAFYIAKSLASSKNDLSFEQDGLFVTPVSTLSWARSKKIISAQEYYPSTQIKALQSFEFLAQEDQQIIKDALNPLTPITDPSNTKQKIGNALSTITEYLLPREADPTQRNHLFSIKRTFPSTSDSMTISAKDLSKSPSPASISALFLPQKNAIILTLRPGFISIENESTSGQKNATIEALRTDLFIDKTGDARVEEFHLARIESNQPSGYLRDGFTQALDISVRDYRTYFDRSLKESKILFGRGISYLYAEHTFSVLPLASAAVTTQDNHSVTNARLEMRINIYKQLTDKTTYVIQATQLVGNHSEIRQAINFNLVHYITEKFSASLNIQKVQSTKQSATLYGLKLTTSF